MTGATLVIGLGRSDCGDDGVGPAVAGIIASRLRNAHDVRVLVEEDPTGLLDVWEGHDHVVIVDAILTEDTAGTIQRLELGAGAAPLPAAALAETGQGGTHAFGLGTAVGLARALHRLPARLILIGVTAGCVDLGAALSPAVAASVGAVAALVWKEVALDVPGRTG